MYLSLEGSIVDVWSQHDPEFFPGSVLWQAIEEETKTPL
jgi:hypothetical protein